MEEQMRDLGMRVFRGEKRGFGREIREDETCFSEESSTRGVTLVTIFLTLATNCNAIVKTYKEEKRLEYGGLYMKILGFNLDHNKRTNPILKAFQTPIL